MIIFMCTESIPRKSQLSAAVVLKGCVRYIFLICFVYLKEGICETWKSGFEFTSKALFVLEIIKFQLFMYPNVMTSSNA